MTNLEEYLARNDPAKNIAYGKQCFFSPSPNDSLTHDSDGSDEWQLTDGYFTQYPAIWCYKEAVSWDSTPAASIKVDLGTEQPFNEVKYSTSAQYSGFSWPKHIYVFTSPDDTNYYFLRDMVSDSPTSTGAGESLTMSLRK